jgi:collagen type I/II/III/V/XI/XXIV/XXVII alpha
VISGGARGIDITGAVGSVTNAGSIGGNQQQGIRFVVGGTVGNLSGGTITGGGTYAGIDLLQGGAVSNAAGGTIVNGVEIDGAAGTVSNSGVISRNSKAVYLSAGGLVTNAGTITGDVEAVLATATVANLGVMAGVTLSAGGAVSNAASGALNLINIFLGDGGSVTNAGVIGGPISPIRAIEDHGAPLILTNLSSGQINGNVAGIAAFGVAATIANAGTITGRISLTDGGTITNQTGGTIGAITTSGTAVVGISNDGVLQEFSLSGNGILLNSGTITGAVGSYLGAGSTLTNLGTITLNSGRTLEFGGANDLLVLNPNAPVNAAIDGGSIGSALELAVGNGSAGSLAGFGSSIVNFSSIAFDSGAKWTIAGQPSGLTGLMTGFAQGDTIDLVGLSETISGYAAGVLTLTGDQTVTLQLPGPFTPASFMATPDAGTGTDVFLACYVRGTRIATPDGEVAVEALGERDIVLLASGESAPIVWIGHRRLNCRRHPKPQLVWPVRVHAHAFGRDLPRRDLLLSPDHAVFVDDVLIPIRYLINDTTIRQAERRSVEYFHIELPRHAILLANGLPAESYLDIGDRSSFENGGGPLHLHPDFASRLWEAEGCAPLCVAGATLAAVRRRLTRIARGAEVPRGRSMSR